MAPVLKYTVLRLALFVAVLALLTALRAGPLLAIVGAALVSMMLAYLFLRGPRDEVTARIAERMERRAGRRGPSAADLDAAVEDAAVDAAEEPPPGTTR